MMFGRWVVGLLAIAVVLVAALLAARALRARWLRELEGSAALLAELVLGVALVVMLLQVLGIVGLLEPWAILLGAVALGFFARGERGLPRLGRLPVVAAVAAALVLAAWLRRTLVSLDLGIGGVDSLWYHLPFATRFAQEGSIAGLPYVDLEFLTAFYPANVELLHAGGLVAFGSDALSPWLNLAFLALGLLAGWCFGAARGAGAVGVLATAVVFAVPSMFESQAGEAKNDAFALATLLASAVFLLAAREERGAHRGLVLLAGLAAGLSAGSKLSLLAPVGALTLAVVVLAPVRQRPRWAGAWLAGLAATSGVWFARNLVDTGNPLPWLDLGPLPNPAEPRSGETADALSAYLFDGGAWDEFFLPGLESALGPAWWAVLALAALGAVLAVLDRDRTVRALGIVALVAAAAYVVTPSTAAGPDGRPVGFALNVRYLAPALLLGLCLLPLARPRRAGVIGLGLGAVLVATQFADPIWAFEHRRKAIVVVALAAAAVAAARLVRLPRALLVAAALVTVVLAGWPLSRDLDRQAYTGKRLPYTAWAAFDLQGAYAWARDQEDARIAVTGTTGAFFQYPLAGRELHNEVRLLGDRGPHGSFTPLRDCVAFRRALAGFTHVVLTPDLDIWEPYRPLLPRERAWLTGSGARERIPGRLVSVHELPPRVGTGGCGRP